MAAAGKLRDPDCLGRSSTPHAQRRSHPPACDEFGASTCMFANVATLDEKSERHFPSFKPLREAMQEEVTRFYIDLFQNDRSVLELVNADYHSLTRRWPSTTEFRSTAPIGSVVDGIKKYGRGGVLGFSATLAKHSGASRDERHHPARHMGQ